MTDTTTTDSLPVVTSDGAGKPATTKPAAKAPTPKSQAAELVTKTTPANPAWAEEIAAQFGLSGPHAKAAAAEILAVVTGEITRKFNRKKLAKIVRESVSKSIV